MSERYINPREIFARWAGMEVPLKTEPYQNPGDDPQVTRTRFALARDPDPVVATMEQEAKRHGLSLRLIWPNQEMPRSDYRDDRVNIPLTHNGDYQWQISPDCYLG